MCFGAKSLCQPLDLIASAGDELLFEAFFLHSVLAAAAYREGIMVEDLLDRFLVLRQVALDVVRGQTTWQTQWIRLHRQRQKPVDRDGHHWLRA